jgi:hypothetical protein
LWHAVLACDSGGLPAIFDAFAAQVGSAGILPADFSDSSQITERELKDRK